MKTIAFFNNVSGVGKTSLVYHLAWMYAEMGRSVIAADLNPQSNLTSMFLDDDRLEKVWPDDDHSLTILGAINPIIKGTGDIAEQPHIERIRDNLGLLIGDLGLSSFEDTLSTEWPKCAEGQERAFRVISAFFRLLKHASESDDADTVLIDVGPNLGAINRAALIAADYVVVPLTPDLYSLQGLRNLGPTLREWRSQWKSRLKCNPVPELKLPRGLMHPIGYVVMQYAIRQDKPVKSYEKWIKRIPDEYRNTVLNQPIDTPLSVEEDFCLSLVKHYRSLMPMAMEARKPMFFLKPADGAIGAHASAAIQCANDFTVLAEEIERACEKHSKLKSKPNK